jgi:two-component system phosphate regulon sensor histidine kinase PhoR
VRAGFVIPLVLLVAATAGLTVLGMRSISGERAVAEGEARQRLAALTGEATARIEGVVQELRRRSSGGEDTVRISALGDVVDPRPPASLPSLGRVARHDAEGTFYLSAAEEAEAAGDAKRAFGLYEVAAADERPAAVRALAHLRLAALARGAGDRVRAETAFRAALDLLDSEERRTREALVARAVNGAGSDPQLVADLLRFWRGPDHVIVAGLLGGCPQVQSADIAAREAELERLDRLQTVIAEIGDVPQGVTLTGGLLCAWSTDRAGRRHLAERELPPVAPEVSCSRTDSLADAPEWIQATASLPSLSGWSVAARTPRQEVEAVADRRGRWMLGTLALLVVGGLAAFLLTVRAVRAEARAARERSAFVGQVGHELRTPLAKIRLYGETLAAGGVVEDDAREFAEIIARESERLSGMVEKVLDIGRSDHAGSQLELVSLDARGLVKEVAEAHRPLCEAAGMVLALRQSEEPLPIRGDADSLRGALGNLVENALRHAAGGGELQIVSALRDGDVIIEVADRGPGLPEALEGRLFERFVRGSGAHVRGTGLGLAIVKEVVEGHRGRVGAKPRPGGGAIFAVTLPSEEPTS